MIDFLLVLSSVFWGANYSIVKNVFSELDPRAFNAVRLSLSSLIFLIVIVTVRARASRGQLTGSIWSVFYTPAKLNSRDWWALLGIAAIGQCGYQYFFISGLAATSVANASLMIGATPVIVALLSAMLRIDRIGGLHWLGAAISMTGIYLVVGQGFSLGSHGAKGDLLMVAAVLCWAVFTIGARPLMARHSPVAVTGISMMIGTLIYVPLTWSHVSRVRWTTVSWSTWAALVYSAVFALCVSYTIWYAGIRQLGTARASMYSNLVPIVAMLSAVFVLQEPLGLRKIVGAGAVLAGVALTRIGPKSLVPPQE